MPLGSAKRCVRASRLAGDGSNASPAGDGGVALVVLDHRRDVDRRRRRGARSGLGSGRNSPTVRFDALEVRRARRAARRPASPCGSGRARGRTAASRRARSPRRSRRRTPADWPWSRRSAWPPSARTRATSASVIGFFAMSAIVASIASRAGLDRLAVGDLREQRQRARVDAADVPRLHRGGLLRSRPATCTAGPTARASARRPARRRPTASGSRAAHRVEHHAEELGVADAPHRHRALAVLHRLLRVDARQRARRLRDRRRSTSRSAPASGSASNLPAMISTALSGW